MKYKRRARLLNNKNKYIAENRSGATVQKSLSSRWNISLSSGSVCKEKAPSRPMPHGVEAHLSAKLPLVLGENRVRFSRFRYCSDYQSALVDKAILGLSYATSLANIAHWVGIKQNASSQLGRRSAQNIKTWCMKFLVFMFFFPFFMEKWPVWIKLFWGHVLYDDFVRGCSNRISSYSKFQLETLVAH